MVKFVDRVIVWLGTCLVGLAVAGCSDRDTMRAKTNPSRSPVTITALVWAPDWPQEMNRIADEFMRANPGITVDVQFMIGNSVEENIKPKVAANKLPDILSINPNAYTARLADQGILVDLTQTHAWNNMVDSLKTDWTSSRQRHYGISGGIAANLIYYNKEMFAKAGVTTLPKNYPEFLAVCARLKKAGFVPILWNGGFPNMLGNGPFSSGFADAVIPQNPAWKTSILDGSLNLDTPAVADIFVKMKTVVDRGFVQKDYMLTTYDEGLRAFTEGRTAMVFHGTWASGTLMHGQHFTTGVMLPPWNDPGKPAIPVIGSETGFGVCDTRNSVAALQFLEFIYGKGFVIQQHKRQNIPPMRIVDGAVDIDPALAAYIRDISAAPRKGTLYYSFLPANTIDMLHPLMQDVLLGTRTARQAAKALNNSIKTEARNQNN